MQFMYVCHVPGARPTHHKITNTSPRHRQDFTRTSPRLHQDFAKTSPGINLDIAKPSPGTCEGLAGPSSRLRQDIAKAPAVLHPGFAKASPSLRQDFAKTLPGLCLNVSVSDVPAKTRRLMGEVLAKSATSWRSGVQNPRPNPGLQWDFAGTDIPRHQPTSP